MPKCKTKSNNPSALELSFSRGDTFSVQYFTSCTVFYSILQLEDKKIHILALLNNKILPFYLYMKFNIRPCNFV